MFVAREEESNVVAWLAAILRRRAVDRWRKRRPLVFVSSEAVFDLGTTDQDPAENEFSDQLQEALGQLPKQLRETLLFVAVGELTHQETADLLEIPLGTILSRVSRARKQLRKALLAAVDD